MPRWSDEESALYVGKTVLFQSDNRLPTSDLTLPNLVRYENLTN